MTNFENMNIINDFLKNPIISEVKEDFIVSDSELVNINDLFASNDVPANYMHLLPKIKDRAHSNFVKQALVKFLVPNHFLPSL